MGKIETLKCGYSMLWKAPKGKINSKTLGYVCPNGIINFQTAEAAENYAKNRCVSVLQGCNPFERGVIVKGNKILAEIDGEAIVIDIKAQASKMKGASFYHGHPTSDNGTLPLSLYDYLLMISHESNKIVAFNKYGEHSTIKQKNKKSFLQAILPKSVKEKIDLLITLGKGSVATKEYANEYAKLFPKEVQEKLKHKMHENVGLPFADSRELKACKQNQLTIKEFREILTKENECIKNGSLANMLDNLWTKLSKKLDFNYETNFSNLNKH